MGVVDRGVDPARAEAVAANSLVGEVERNRLGITDGLVRIAVGLEALSDIKADLERGLS